MERKVGGFRECDKSLKHQSMSWNQFKDPLCYPCLVGYVVISWSLTQEVVGSNNISHKSFITEFSGDTNRKLGCVVVMVTLRLVYLIVVLIVALLIIRCHWKPKLFRRCSFSFVHIRP